MKNSKKKWHIVSVYPPVNSITTGWLPCKEYCLAMFKSYSWRYLGEGVFEFESEKDALIFSLKWS